MCMCVTTLLALSFVCLLFAALFCVCSQSCQHAALLLTTIPPVVHAGGSLSRHHQGCVAGQCDLFSLVLVASATIMGICNGP